MVEVQRPGAGAGAEVAGTAVAGAGALAASVAVAVAQAEAEAEAETGNEAATPVGGRLARTSPCDTRLARTAARILAFHGADDVRASTGTGTPSARKRPRLPPRRGEDSLPPPVIRPAAVKRPATTEDLWGGCDRRFGQAPLLFASVLGVRTHAAPHCAGEILGVEAMATAALSVVPSPWRARDRDADTMAVAVAEGEALLMAVLHAGVVVAEAEALSTASLHAGGASATALAAAVAAATETAATVVAQAAAPREVSAVAWFATVVALVLRMVMEMEVATEVKLVAVGVAAVATRAVG